MLRKVVTVAITIVAVGMIAYAFSTSESEEVPANTGARAGQVFANEAVERFIPQAGDQIPGQDEIGVDLKPGYEAELIIDEINIPKDQMLSNDALYQYTFRAGDGKVIERLSPGSVCAVAVITKQTDPGAGPQQVEWCFEVN